MRQWPSLAVAAPCIRAGIPQRQAPGRRDVTQTTRFCQNEFTRNHPQVRRLVNCRCGPANFAGTVRELITAVAPWMPPVKRSTETPDCCGSGPSLCSSAAVTEVCRWSRSSAAVLLLFVSSGCMNPQFTRFPTWGTWFPSAENAAYDRQDPFPDPDIGPSLDSTPRGYERPRTEARRAAEQRMLQGLPVGPESMPRGIPQGTRNDDRAVR
jgi:hypothetical protein